MTTTIIATTVTSLNNALTLARYAVATRAALPILAHTRFQFLDGTLVLEATNLEQWLRIPMQGMLKGDLQHMPALDHRFLSELCAKLPANAELTLQKDKQRPEVVLTCEGSEYRLLGLPAEEFPSFPEPDETTQRFVLNGIQLCKLVKQVLPAVSKEEARAILQCVRLEIPNGDQPQVVAVTTDTHRLHYTKGNAIKEPPQIGVAFHINQTHWSSLLNHWEHQPHVECQLNSRGQLIWKTPHAEGAVLTVEGTYPNYERVIPTEHTQYLVLPTKELVVAVQRLLLFAESYKIRVRYEPEPSQLVLEAISDKGDGRETIPVAETNLTETCDICAINGRYWLDAIRAFQIQTLQMEGQELLKPFVMREADPNTHGRAVIMPMAW